MTFEWLIIDLLAFVVVTILAGVIIPQILLIAFRKNLFDDNDPRKVHKGTVPRLGGIAFFPSILFSMMMVTGCVDLMHDDSVMEVFANNMGTLSFIFCSIIALYLIGMADDLIGVKYRAKFVAQICAALIVICGGVMITRLHGFLWVTELPVVVSVLLSVLLTVFITNAVNLIDGIDGLASGLSAIACAFYGYACFRLNLYVYSLLAYATLGALVPFFYYNVFGNATKHSKIFMGDTGTLTIGLILSVLSIKICSLPQPGTDINLAVVAFAPLLIPCCDVVRVYLHRIKQGRSPFLPDKTHIHHKLLALGMSQRAAMPTIVGASLVVTMLNYVCCYYVNITLLFFSDIALWIVGNMILSRAIRRRQRRTGIILYK